MDELQPARVNLFTREIISIQFSPRKGEGWFFPHSEGDVPWVRDNRDFIKVAKAIMALPNVKFGHNVWWFDNPILEENDYKIDGTVHDTMAMFHHWQPDLEKGLQKAASLFDFPFPWKHKFGTEWYGCVDVDAPWYLIEGLLPLMKARGSLWEGYKNMVLGLRKPLRKAEKRGIPVNEVRHASLTAELEEEAKLVYQEIQEEVPEEIRNIKPRRKIESSNGQG